ncbi:MAG: four-helix bundle copper-binding protein [Chakrabartia sp.]
MSLPEMIAAHPLGEESPALAHAVAEAMTCAAICLGCADACLSEEDPARLAHCIRLDLDCADICTAFVHLAMREPGGRSPRFDDLIRHCAEACEACADECDQHADMHAHCVICARSCRKCAEACRAVLDEAREAPASADNSATSF